MHKIQPCKVKTRNNYHMTDHELVELCNFLKDRYDSKWFLGLMLQLDLGLRGSDLMAINVATDFNHDFSRLNYQDKKTNKMIYNEPIYEPVRRLLLTYIKMNAHRIKDGWLFPKHNGKGIYMSGTDYSTVFGRWRTIIKRSNPAWDEKYPYRTVKGKISYRYRIDSHSIRRYHRTFLWKNIRDRKIVKELCHYSKYETLDRYINDFEIIENKDRYLIPTFTPLMERLISGQRQTKIAEF